MPEPVREPSAWQKTKQVGKTVLEYGKKKVKEKAKGLRSALRQDSINTAIRQAKENKEKLRERYRQFEELGK